MTKTRWISIILVLALAVSVFAPAWGDIEDAVPAENGSEEVISSDSEEVLPVSEAPAAEEEEAHTEDPEPAGEEKPVADGKPAKDEKPIGDEKPVEDEEPAEDEKSVEDEKPIDDGKPVEDGKPAEEEEPAEDGKPAKDGKPIEDEKPAGEETEEEIVHFSEGYILIKANTMVYALANATKVLGTVTADSYAWAVIEKEAEDPDRDWLRVWFDTDDAQVSAFVRFKVAGILTADQQATLEAKLIGQKDRMVNGKPIPKAEYKSMEDTDMESDDTDGEAEPEQPVINNEEHDKGPGQLVYNAPKLTVKLTPSKVAALSVGGSRTIKTVVSNAEGTVTYRWEVSTNSGKTWKDAGVTSATLTAKMTENNYLKLSNYQYRCNVTDKNGTACSTPVKIRNLITVTAPKTVRGGLDAKVKMTVTVSSYVSGTRKYQWQVSTNGGKKWKECTYTGNNTATLTVKITEKRYAFLFRCAVTIDGKKMYSNTVSLEKPYSVVISPARRTVDIGAKGQFTVTPKGATGKTTYQWQYSKDGGKTWKSSGISGYNTKTLFITARYDRYGQMFRCLVSAGNGKVVSDAVWINPAKFNHYIYSDNGTGQLIIVRYKKDETSIVIPAGYAGKPVVGIAANVFKGKSVQTIVIPPSVTSIGESAFESCTSLKTVTLSDYVKSIGKAAFKNCKKLKEMKIANK